MTEYNIFAERLKEILSDKMTQSELSKKTGITEVTISRYANGQRVPKATEIVKIAQALNVSCDYLLGYDEKDMSVRELITKLNILSNNITLSVNECMEYHKTKIIVEKIYKNILN